MNRFKKWKDLESTPLQLASSTATNDIDTHDSRTNHRLSSRTEDSASRAPSTPRAKKSPRFLLPFFCLSRHLGKTGARSSAKKIVHEDRYIKCETKEESSQSSCGDEQILPSDSSLGVAFAHPVYTGRSHLLMVGTNPDNSTYDLWTRMASGYSMEADDFPLPPTKTIVQTAEANSWGSDGGSSSLYPTDEQSNDEGNFEYGSFDSDADIPFDEIFRNKRYFESDPNSNPIATNLLELSAVPGNCY